MTVVAAFDLDGTLLDPGPRHRAVASHVMQELGVAEFDAEHHWDLKRSGHSTEAALRAAGYPAEVCQRASARWIDAIEDASWLRLDVLIPGVTDVMEPLRDSPDRVVLVTARRSPGALEGQLASLGIDAWFDEVHVVDPSEAAGAKRVVLEHEPATWFIGDTESDARAADAARVPFVAVTSGMRTRRFLADAGVGEIVDDLAHAVRRCGRLAC